MTPNTALVSIGNGIGAGLRNGMVYVLSGPDMARIERERRDGPRWCEAVRGAREMRRRHSLMHMNGWGNYQADRAHYWELDEGIPVCWTAGVPVGWFVR